MKILTAVFLLLAAAAGVSCGGEAIAMQVAQYAADDDGTADRHYPGALPSLLKAARECTGLPFADEPLLITSFCDRRLAACPALYLNWDERDDWEKLGAEEAAALRGYLENGGMAIIDAGITASFLRQHPGAGQSHSFAEWRERPEVRAFFSRVLPRQPFRRLDRDDPIFSGCFAGLPDPSLLPETVREYAVNEKWPSGSYSAVAIRIDGHVAAVALPIMALGWERNPQGGWETAIRLRVLESGDRLDEALSRAAVNGGQYEVVREDGGTDEVFCQDESLPAWVREPGGRWRIYRYYDSRQINDFTHVFYTRLGINLLMAAVLGE